MEMLLINIAVLRPRHVLLLLLMTLVVTPAFSDSAALSPRLYGETEEPYDSRFLGVSYEYYSYLNLDQDSDGEGRFSPRRAGATFTYGFPGLRMPRVRVGVGWEPERPLYISTGVEIPLFERFSRANGRNFGIFLLGDVVAGIPREPRVTGEATLVGLIPMGNIGGISVGAGATHRGEALVSIGIMTGVFPMDDRN
ncbi:MAG: hypothetical protein R6U25_07040 [Alkalispirochaeta sp.]